jgi:MFS family permease
MKKMNWLDHISVNLFWLGLNIRNNSVNSVILPFMVANLAAPEIRNTALGGINTAGLVIAMLVQPAMGILSDRSTSRFGRRRPFIFVGVLLDLLCLALIAASGSYWFLLAAILLFQFSSNVSHGALQGLMPDLVPEDQRGVSSGVKSIFELVPVVLVALVISKLVAAGYFLAAVAATGASLLIIMLLTMLLVKEVPLTQKPDIPLGPPMARVAGVLAGIGLGAVAGLLSGGVIGGLAGAAALSLLGQQTALAILVGLGGMVAMVAAVIIGVWAGAFVTIGQEADRQGLQQKLLGGIRSFAARNGSFTWWVVNRLLFLTAITSLQKFAPFFLMYVFKINIEEATSMTANLFLVVGLCTLVTAVPSGWLSDRLGSHRLLVVSGVLAGLGAFLLLGTIWLPNLALIYLAGVVLGLATGLFVTINWALGTRLVPPAEAGRYMGISNLAGAGAGIVGTGIGGPMADYLEKVQPGLGYFVLFASYGVLFVLSAVSMIGIKQAKL